MKSFIPNYRRWSLVLGQKQAPQYGTGTRRICRGCTRPRRLCPRILVIVVKTYSGERAARAAAHNAVIQVSIKCSHPFWSPVIQVLTHRASGVILGLIALTMAVSAQAPTQEAFATPDEAAKMPQHGVKTTDMPLLDRMSFFREHDLSKVTVWCTRRR